MLLADGFEEALIGVLKCKGREDVACYDYGACVAILISRDGISAEEAHEHMGFNVTDAYVGELTPAFLVRPSSDEIPLEFVNYWSDEGF